MGIRNNRITTKGKDADSLAGDLPQQRQERSKIGRNFNIIIIIYLLIIVLGPYALCWGYHFSFIAELIACLVFPLPLIAFAICMIITDIDDGWSELSDSLWEQALVILFLVFYFWLSGKTIVDDIKDCFGGTVTREISVTAFTTPNLREPHPDYYMEGFLDDGTPIKIGVSFCFGGSLAVPGRSAKAKFFVMMPHCDSDTVKGKITYYPNSLKFINFEEL